MRIMNEVVQLIATGSYRGSHVIGRRESEINMRLRARTITWSHHVVSLHRYTGSTFLVMVHVRFVSCSLFVS